MRGKSSAFCSKGPGLTLLFVRVRATLTASPYTNEEGSKGKTREAMLCLASFNVARPQAVDIEGTIPGKRFPGFAVSLQSQFEERT